MECCIDFAWIILKNQGSIRCDPVSGSQQHFLQRDKSCVPIEQSNSPLSDSCTVVWNCGARFDFRNVYETPRLKPISFRFSANRWSERLRTPTEDSRCLVAQVLVPELWASWGELDAEEGDNSRTDPNQQGLGFGTGQDSAKPSYRTRFRPRNLRIVTYPREKR